MLGQISRRIAIALAMQAGGVVMMGVSMLAPGTALMQLGALNFVIGCILEARAQPRPSESAETSTYQIFP
jgi:hypothetical protein